MMAPSPSFVPLHNIKFTYDCHYLTVTPVTLTERCSEFALNRLKVSLPLIRHLEHPSTKHIHDESKPDNGCRWIPQRFFSGSDSPNRRQLFTHPPLQPVLLQLLKPRGAAVLPAVDHFGHKTKRVPMSWLLHIISRPIPLLRQISRLQQANQKPDFSFELRDV